jgi:hypothetical protein
MLVVIYHTIRRHNEKNIRYFSCSQEVLGTDVTAPALSVLLLVISEAQLAAITEIVNLP